MSPLTPEEEATLRELEAEVAKPAEEPAPKDARFDRFIAEPVGMDDDGQLFPIPDAPADAPSSEPVKSPPEE